MKKCVYSKVKRHSFYVKISLHFMVKSIHFAVKSIDFMAKSLHFTVEKRRKGLLFQSFENPF